MENKDPKGQHTIPPVRVARRRSRKKPPRNGARPSNKNYHKTPHTCIITQSRQEKYRIAILIILKNYNYPVQFIRMA